MTKASSTPWHPEGADASPCSAVRTGFASPNTPKLSAARQRAELIIDVQKKVANLLGPGSTSPTHERRALPLRVRGCPSRLRTPRREPRQLVPRSSDPIHRPRSPTTASLALRPHEQEKALAVLPRTPRRRAPSMRPCSKKAATSPRCAPFTGCWPRATDHSAASQLLPAGTAREPPINGWSWDITRLKGPVKWTYFHLYVIGCLQPASSAAHRESHSCRAAHPAHLRKPRHPPRTTDPARRPRLLDQAGRAAARRSRGHQDRAPPRLRRQPLLGGPVQDLEIPTGLPRPVRIHRRRPCHCPSQVQPRTPTLRYRPVQPGIAPPTAHGDIQAVAPGPPIPISAHVTPGKCKPTHDIGAPVFRPASPAQRAKLPSPFPRTTPQNHKRQPALPVEPFSPAPTPGTPPLLPVRAPQPGIAPHSPGTPSSPPDSARHPGMHA